MCTAVCIPAGKICGGFFEFYLFASEIWELGITPAVCKCNNILTFPPGMMMSHSSSIQIHEDLCM